ncbi:hypothetical protein I7I48_03350 [Histoplasma ohiense]|nr:hypothetical protein I7I48_03350 [Histoplasma ohiense (nom. inval.)]
MFRDCREVGNVQQIQPHGFTLAESEPRLTSNKLDPQESRSRTHEFPLFDNPPSSPQLSLSFGFLFSVIEVAFVIPAPRTLLFPEWTRVLSGCATIPSR